jgi:hypothetical protein
MKRWLATALLLVSLCAARSAHAHKPSDAYLTLKPHAAGVALRLDVALRDLDHALGLDANGDAQLTWGELRARRSEIASYVGQRLLVRRGEQRCAAQEPELAVVSHSDGGYAVVSTDLACAAADEPIELEYGLFFDLDPQHRGIVRIEDGGAGHTAVFSAELRSQKLAPGRTESGFSAMIGVGIEHIFEGLDHLAFLLALLLPSVLRRSGGRWQPAPSLKSALLDAVKIATAFTLAHSITLSLAALEIVSLPSRLVEATIACSVVIAAVNNIEPIFTHTRWAVAFLLGLIHGFGFAASLGDLGLSGRDALAALLGFNLGVELGQCAVVALFVPLAFLLRKTTLYRGPALVGGSVGIVGVAFVWLLERALDLELFG